MTEDHESVEQINTEIVYQQDKANIDTQIATAKAYPRDMKKCLAEIMFIVTMDKDTAATCCYSVPRGGKAVTGPSVHLAKIIAQSFGNMRIESKVVAVDARQTTSEAVCWDLEKNLAMKSQIKKSIVGKQGRFNDDMITVTGNAANSIALRNAIFNVVPRAIVDKAYNAAKELITGDTSTEDALGKRRKEVLERLKTAFSITEQEILSSVGKTAIGQLTTDDLVTLIGLGTAIKDGETTVDSAFKGKKESVKASPSDAAAEALKNAEEKAGVKPGDPAGIKTLFEEPKEPKQK
jgi:hypothetical protein